MVFLRKAGVWVYLMYSYRYTHMKTMFIKMYLTLHSRHNKNGTNANSYVANELGY